MTARSIRPVVDVGTPVEIEVAVLEEVVLTACYRPVELLRGAVHVRRPRPGGHARRVRELAQVPGRGAFTRAGDPTLCCRVLAEARGDAARALAGLPDPLGAADTGLRGAGINEG